MGFDVKTQWDVRTTGSDSNGGGFAYGLGAKTVSAATDLAVDASNNLKVTSATHNFVTGDVNKYINVTSGPNWAVGYYQIILTASNAAILDRSPAPVGATSGHYDLYAAIDYSQQDSAQIAFTDMVIGATTTQFTSAGNPVTDAMVGNIINVTSGTGFTVQRVQITSQSGGTATCDKSLGTAASTGGHGNLGGGLLTIATVNGLIVAASSGVVNNVHIKSGTYTHTTEVDIAQPSVWIGYNTNHWDYGTKPLITTATNSTKLFGINIGSNPGVIFDNLSLSNTASIRSWGVYAQASQALFAMRNCVLDGFTYGVNVDFITSPNGFSATGFGVYNTEIKNCATFGIIQWYNATVRGCYLHGNGKAISNTSNSTQNLSLIRNIINANTYGFYSSGGGTTFVEVQGNDISNNTSDGINSQGGLVLDVQNNIFYGNGGYAINNLGGAGVWAQYADYNAYGSNTSGRFNGTSFAGPHDVPLTADPFTNSSGGDFSLNSTVGGGAACKGAGFQQ